MASVLLSFINYSSMATLFFLLPVIVVESLESTSHGLSQLHETVCVVVYLGKATGFGKAD